MYPGRADPLRPEPDWTIRASLRPWYSIRVLKSGKSLIGARMVHANGIA
jgi:hypothetical protein